MKHTHEPPKADQEPEPSPLVAAGRLLAERGVYGLVWFDEELYVTARYGRLADFIEVGEPLLNACLPLIGLEQDILALKGLRGKVLDLPSVLLATLDQSMPRLNLTVFWHEDGRHFLMLLARSSSYSDLEGELSRQMRARLIAETAVAEKSRELARANSELARANQDLEDFAAIISHDLKSPLRALRYAADDMASLIDKGDVETARQRLDEIGQRTLRMSDMMTALLDYASVGRKAEIAEPVETRGIAEAIVGSLAIPEGFAVEITGRWPEVTTAAAALDLVLRNLVQNAIVHHDRSAGNITLEAKDGRKTFTISVIDDGPGIEPAHHAAILLPFRTLNARAGSTGMGLAFVNRTVATLGGRLEIRSDPAKKRGATFRLIWPKKLDDEATG